MTKRHVTGRPFTVFARDGVTLAPTARFETDTFSVGPGQRYDVLWRHSGPEVVDALSDRTPHDQ